jgi:hypothetical protein
VERTTLVMSVPAIGNVKVMDCLHMRLQLLHGLRTVFAIYTNICMGVIYVYLGGRIKIR